MGSNDLNPPESPEQSDHAEAESDITRQLRLATWNMDHWKRNVQQRRDGWSYLNSKSLADVALLQECLIPSEMLKSRYRYREIGGNRAWGSAVALFNDSFEIEEIGTVRSRYSSTKFSMLGTFPGTIMVTRVFVPEIGPITFVSVYGMIDVYSQTTMLRIVADLIPLFDSSDGQRVILGGDFNLTTATNPHGAEYQRYDAILKAVESLGLKNVAETAEQRAPSIEGCLCGEASCHHLNTYGDSPGTQLDWLYATPELARRCRLIKVEREGTEELSDHAPVIAEFDIPLGDYTAPWEPATFAQEIGVRYGRSVQLVVEEIIAWALRKQESLVRKRRPVNLDRFPISDGRDPEMWLQLDMKRPDKLQYTFSINTKGNVIIQFQYMSVPFDTLEEREKLWSDISRIQGINLEKRLRGRPTFPITLLTASNVLNEFLAVFDEFIERSL